MSYILNLLKEIDSLTTDYALVEYDWIFIPGSYTMILPKTSIVSTDKVLIIGSFDTCFEYKKWYKLQPKHITDNCTQPQSA